MKSQKFLGIKNRPGYFYLFGENRDWNSRDNLKIKLAPNP